MGRINPINSGARTGLGEAADVGHLVEAVLGEDVVRAGKVVVAFQVPVQAVEQVSDVVPEGPVPLRCRHGKIQVRAVPPADAHEVDSVRVPLRVELLDRVPDLGQVEIGNDLD